LSDLKKLNQTAPRFMTQESDRNQCIHGRPQNCFQERATSNFAYPFQVADDSMQTHVDKTLHPFYSIILCCLNLYSQSSV